MKLYEALPDTVTVKGRKIRVDLDFRNVLRMIEILQDDSLIKEARDYLAAKCICKHPRPGVLQEVKKLLFPDPVEWHQKITDYDQDADLIRAAFRQVYGIDLYRTKLHWFEFTAYISGIPGGTRYSDILSIRARPMPEANPYNEEERRWLANAKAEYAVRMSDKEEKAEYKKGLEALAKGFQAMIGGG